VGKEPVCDGKKLEEIGMSVEPVIKSFGTVKRNRLRYWVLKFLSRHQGERYSAVVLDEFKRKYRIVLSIIFKPGEEILVEVNKVDPWEDSIELAYVGEMNDGI